MQKIHWSTRNRVILSYLGDSIIFHKGNFLKLQGIVLPHPPKVDKKRELRQEYSINKGIVIYNSLKNKDRKERATPYNPREREILRIEELCKEK